jgi:hypothetical protein
MKGLEDDSDIFFFGTLLINFGKGLKKIQFL